MAQGGVYFPVTADFCDTQAVRMVRRRFGAEGFEAYVRLLCLLLREEGGRLSLGTGDDWEDLSDQLGTDVDGCRELVTVLGRYGAVVLGEGVLFSPLVSDSINAYLDIREKRAAAGRASGEARRKRKEAGE